ncbi:hypothetical protein EVAR_48641_1 [Eumeta japonica]|uniref:Uncharacterized protein n=1 Tax=Eumeta variegata TaxID=151549 RepID=A0A4C1XRH5_EUMVA|nr:hypothetical protein EVAR_48641_1 [Eumeta japonica]
MDADFGPRLGLPMRPVPNPRMKALSEHRCWDPKDGEPCLVRSKSEETLMEARSDSDVRIDRRNWAVTHRSTDLVRRCLTSMIGREPPYSPCRKDGIYLKSEIKAKGSICKERWSCNIGFGSEVLFRFKSQNNPLTSNDRLRSLMNARPERDACRMVIGESTLSLPAFQRGKSKVWPEFQRVLVATSGMCAHRKPLSMTDRRFFMWEEWSDVGDSRVMERELATGTLTH